MGSSVQPDPIRSWFEKYVQNLQSVGNPAASDATATATALPSLQGAPGPTIGAQSPYHPAQPVPGILGSLLSIGNTVHNAIWSRRQVYSAGRAASDVGDLTGVGPAIDALKNNSPLGALAAVAPFMLPGGEEAAPAEEALASRLASLPKGANGDVLKILDQMRSDAGGTILPRVSAIDVPSAQRMAKVYESLPTNDPDARAAYDALNADAAGKGLVNLPPGADPTAFAQAGIWDALASKIKGASPSQGTFDDIFDQKLSAAASRWGVTPAQANLLFWQGHPFDLDLGSQLIPRKLRSTLNR